jgi:aminomethyltransferase
MKKTVFYDIHVGLKAKIVDFAGFQMPVEYSGITDEHMAVCEHAGLFDVSHMGEIWVKGPHALEFLQKVTSNDVSKLFPGRIQYSCLPNDKGGIVDDILVHQFENEKYFLVVNASNTEKDWQWLNKQNDCNAILENSTESISQLALQGPKAKDILQQLTSVDLSGLKNFHFTVGDLAGVNDVIISNTGYTGAGGYEVYFNKQNGTAIWDSIMKAGNNFGIKPIGLGARDTLRLEMGFCLYGNDIDDTTSPIEAGLGWIVSFMDNKNFIDKEILFKQSKGGTSRKLVGFEMVERSIPRHGYNICDNNGKLIGQVTSGTMSPVLKKGIGLGYVQSAYSSLGSEIFISIRDKQLPAKVVALPFVKRRKD